MTCRTVVKLDVFGMCSHCGRELALEAVTDIQLPMLECVDNRCLEFGNEPKPSLIQKHSEINAKNAIKIINNILPRKSKADFSVSRLGWQLVQIRQKLQYRDGDHQETPDSLNEKIKKKGFYLIPLQGGIFFSGDLFPLAQWIMRQSKARIFDLAFLFKNDSIHSNNDFHLIFVHIENNRAIIVFPHDQENNFVMLFFTPEITMRLIERYFELTSFNEILVYHRTSELDRKKRKKKR